MQTELCAFNDRLHEFKALDCDVIACSVDSKFSHLAWTQVCCTSYPQGLPTNSTCATLRADPPDQGGAWAYGIAAAV